MRLKHNKKRNTAFVYEALVRELTKAVIRKNSNKKNKIVSIIKEHFSGDTMLAKELSLYRAIYETKDLERTEAERLIFEARLAHKSLDSGKLFREQSALIQKINKSMSSDIYNNFVPNYRSIASAYSIFSKDVEPKDRVLLEGKMAEVMSSTASSENSEEVKHIDNLVYKTFVDKFNTQYGNSLLEEQKELLSKYIASFSDNGVELKVYMNEEIGRLKTAVAIAKSNEHILADEDMSRKAKKVYELLEAFKEREVDDTMLERTLKIQDLVKEISE